MRGATILLLLALAACTAGGEASGPYIGGSVGGNIREDARAR
jgi:hypothetical protein